MDLHVPQIQGFFDIPVDHLFAAPVLVDYFNRLNLSDLIVVSPDAGGTERARAYAKKLNTSIAIIDKRRLEANVAEIMNIIGEVEGRTAVIVDDIIDTAGTLVKSAEALLHQGPRRFMPVVPIRFVWSAAERIRRSEITEVVVRIRFRSRPRLRRWKKFEFECVRFIGQSHQIDSRRIVCQLFVYLGRHKRGTQGFMIGAGALISEQKIRIWY